MGRGGEKSPPSQIKENYHNMEGTGIIVNTRICTHCGEESQRWEIRDELTMATSGKVVTFCSDCLDLHYSDCMIQWLAQNPTISVSNITWKIYPIPGIDIIDTCNGCEEPIEIDDIDYLRGKYLPSGEDVCFHTDCYDTMRENWKRDYKMEDEDRIPKKSALCITVLELDI